MKRREFITLVGGAAAAWPLPTSAQQAGKPQNIGVFVAGTPSSHGQWIAGFATTNFYFHLSMVYAILRSRGVPLGKRDLFAGGL